MSFKDFFTKSFTELENKSANISVGGQQDFTIVSSCQSNDQTVNRTLSPKELVEFNTHWVFISNSKNANTCATIPLKLYYENKTGKKLVQNSQPVKGKIDVVEILEHPFIDLMKNINEGMNYTDLSALTFGYMGLVGNAYWWLDKDGKGLPQAIYPLMSEYVITKLDKPNGKIVGYKYFDNTYKVEDVIQFSNFCPGSLLQGKGELEACIDAVRRYCYYNYAESALNKNNARPDFVVSYKTKLNDNEQKDIEKIWYKKFGRKGIGRPLITSEATILPLGLPPKDMAYPAGRDSAIKEILACFGVPEALVFLNSANLASSRSANSHYMKYTIFPKMDRYVEKLNEQLLPLYDYNLYADYDRSLEADPLEQSTVLSNYVMNNIISINEAREKIGLEPIDDPEPVKPVGTLGVQNEQ